jgi:hypothetical protein
MIRADAARTTTLDAQLGGSFMADASVPTGHLTVGSFRVGNVISRAASMFLRNFPIYFVVTAIAGVPPLLVGVLVPASPVAAANPFQNAGAGGFTLLLTIVVWLLSQAIVLCGVFQAMRGRPLRLADCLKVGLRRFFPLIGLAIFAGIATLAYTLFLAFAIVQLTKVLQPAVLFLASLPLIVPILILYLMWFVAMPVCVLEPLGPFRSLGRSRALTKGHRWKIFWLILAILIPALIVAGVISAVMARLGIAVNLRIGLFFGLNGTPNSVAAQVVSLIWTAIWTAFYAILVAVAYHDLRVAKEGVDTEQIAAVFE